MAAGEGSWKREIGGKRKVEIQRKREREHLYHFYFLLPLPPEFTRQGGNDKKNFIREGEREISSNPPHYRIPEYYHQHDLLVSPLKSRRGVKIIKLSRNQLGLVKKRKKRGSSSSPSFGIWFIMSGFTISPYGDPMEIQEQKGGTVGIKRLWHGRLSETYRERQQLTSSTHSRC